MKKEYDLSKMKSRRNPYARHLKQQVTMRLGTEALHYFKSLSQETGVPYQNLINSYLMDCMLQKKKPHFVWK